MSQITDFYSGEGKDSEGRTFYEIIDEGNDWWEFQHDYIQWIFPLADLSNFNPDAPLLTEEDIAVFKKDLLAQHHLRGAFGRFLWFLGLEWDGQKVFKGLNFEERKVNIWQFPNHNWLRITRCLRCLKTLGLANEADSFFNMLQALHAVDGFGSENSFKYWREAVQDVGYNQSN